MHAMKIRFLFPLFCLLVLLLSATRVLAQAGSDGGVPIRIWLSAQSQSNVGSTGYCPSIYAPPHNFTWYSVYQGTGFTMTGTNSYGGSYVANFWYWGSDSSLGYTRYGYYFTYTEQLTGYLSLGGTFLASTPPGPDAAVSNTFTTLNSNQAINVGIGPNGVVRAAPFKSYVVGATMYGVTGAALNVAAPPQYKVLINGVERNRCGLGGSGGLSLSIMLVPRYDGPPGAAGFSSGLAADRIDWKLPLGTLRNGDDAGCLRIVEPGSSADWTSIFNTSSLQCTAGSNEVYVYWAGNAIKQVIANQVAVDVEVPAGTTNLYKIHCYSPSQIATAGPPTTFTGSPFATYTVRQSDDAGDPATALKIIREFRNAAGSVVRTESTKLVRTGTSPAFTWTKSDWHTGTTVLQETVASISVSGSTRTESVALRKPGSPPTVAMSATRTYSGVSFGEALTAETVGTTQARTVNFNYHADTGQPGSLGFAESVRIPGGTWEAYDYWDATQAMSYQGGRVKYKYRPYGPTGTDTPMHSTSEGEVTYYEYGPDPFGFNTRPTLIQTTINNIVVNKTTISYNSTAEQGIITSTKNEYASATVPLTTTTTYYSEGWSDPFLRGKPTSITRPDGVRQNFTYEKGSWNGSTFTPNGTTIPTTVGTRMYVETVQSNGAPLTNVSTREVTIRDYRALVVRIERHVYTGASWQLVTWTNFSYNFAGLLSNRTSSNGATYAAAWEGNLKIAETDESGIATSYTSFDAAGRVLTATKASATSGAITIPALTTTYTYDAASKVTQEQVGPVSGESLTTTKAYDDAGRIISETAPGLSAIAHTYDVFNRSHTVTKADNSTLIETSNLDGTLASKTGTGAVPQYYTYGIESDGRRWTRTDLAARISDRWTKTWTDWLGRKTTTRRPGFTGQADLDEVNFYDASTSSNTGRLLKTTKPGVAATLFGYNALSQLTRNGLDIDGGATLVTSSSDRIADTSEAVEYFAGSWWLSKTDSSYPYEGGSAATVVQMAKTSKRLDGLGDSVTGGVLTEETRTWDIFNNETRRTVAVDADNKLTTITTMRVNSSGTAVLTQVEKFLNGLPISTQSFEGLTTTAGYDTFWRRNTTTDPRTGTTTTTYHPNSALVKDVTDPASKRLSWTEYDGLGRVIFTKDALNYTTRTAYTLRGEVLQTWGTATYPVSYEYSVYGERTKMTTYQDANDAATTDTSTFPSVGTGNETTWEFDAPSGLLKKKYDAKAKFVEYDYDAAGRLSHRYWSRVVPSGTNAGQRVTTTYSYSATTGEQTGVSYNDGTPGLTYVFDRAAHNTSVTQTYASSSVQTLLDYCLCGKISTEYLDGTFFGGRNLNHFTNTNSDGFKGRSTGYGLSVGATVEQSTTYGYNSSTGRFSSLATSSAISASNHTFNYAYTANSNLVSGYSVDTGHPFTLSRIFNGSRDLMTSIEVMWSATSRVKYEYTYDDRRQRANVVQSGDVFNDYGGPSSGAIHINFAYNGRGELIQAASWLGNLSATEDSTTFMSARKHEFSYDGIGNRRWSNAGGVTGTRDNYTVNELNQYIARENNTLPVGGTVANDSAIKVAAGANAVAVAGRHGRHWGDNMLLDNLSGPFQGPVKFYAAKLGTGGAADLVKSVEKTAFIPPAWEAFTYDNDGNILSDGVWNYTWDAENRLVAMETKSVVIGAGIASADVRRLEFTYDYLGRRIEKIVKSGWNGSTYANTPDQRRFIYDGWNLIAEYSVSGGALTLKRSYTWGLDIIHTLAESGGVGALLQIADHATSKAYFVSYDGNGNVAALFDNASSGGSPGATVAAYEYSPYGEFLRCEGTYAKNNPFRFSTKFADDETSLIYYGHRYYSQTQGRFFGRDSIDESGGLNLYGFVGNEPISRWDFLGRVDSGKPLVLPTFFVPGQPVSGATLSSILDSIFGDDNDDSQGAAADRVSKETCAEEATKDYNKKIQDNQKSYLDNVNAAYNNLTTANQLRI
jgi:RHS repeat-associated protein